MQEEANQTEKMRYSWIQLLTGGVTVKGETVQGVQTHPK